MHKINLFCLPFAGGSKYSYQRFVESAPKHLNIVPIEIPGRGARFNEPLLTDAGKIINDIFNQIKDSLDQPYAIYGHSMGSLLSYLLVKKILQQGLQSPQYLFLTGCKAPSQEYKSPARHLLSQEEFIEELKILGGCPDEILNDPDLLNFFEPILRADFQAIETYNYTPSEPFDIPVHIIIGTEEKVTEEEAQGWKSETTGEVEVQSFPGKHFFIFNYSKEIIQLISHKLSRSLQKM